ncbi:hypothetical protein [Arthrobacter sp. PM3]|uniref:hypothetical protein n=1 Tax=Arthrobacter sp. PM3 TaxID=2017685 RepID=UPI000E10A8A7|nr:hypothetical protein [Arthrobacter sp. PM3]AXJ08857.1 hypothetical protein CFN17_03890 [Arthrobacter sp. PM3]
MRQLTKKSKVIAVAASAALVAVGGGTAYAYWTTTGTGAGTATNSAGGGTVVLHANFDAGLAPGNSETVTYTADNSSNTGTVVGTLTPSVITSVAECLPAWFTVTAKTSNAAVAANSNGTEVGTGTLTFLNSDANQDSCKSAVVTVTVASE